jgi:hypothetical protein
MIGGIHNECFLLTQMLLASTLFASTDSFLFPEVRMAMNIKKVVIGGIVAGVVMNVIDFVTNTYIFGARMKAEADAFKPGLSDQMMGGSAVVSYIIMDFVLGIALVWTYAAIRPRFGPGLRTATFAALLFWLLALIFLMGYLHMGMMSSGLWWSFAIAGLINFFLSAWAGAKVYTEDGVVA